MAKRILEADKGIENDAKFEKNKQAQMQKLTKNGDYEALAKLANQTQDETSLKVKSRDKTFHYLPYNFIQSKFDFLVLKDTQTEDENLATLQNSINTFFKDKNYAD